MILSKFTQIERLRRMAYTKKTLFMMCLLSIFDVSEGAAPPLSEAQIREVVNAIHRTSEDKDKDPGRMPTRVMAFAGVSLGHHVLDLYAGGGWYTELFSGAVGVEGRVYAQNDKLTWRFGGKELTERTKNNRLSNVIRIDPVEIKDIVIPQNSVDIAFMAINYHDLFFTHRTREGKVQILRDQVVDYKSAFINVKNILKEEGVLIVIDHIAKSGSGYRAANDLHRIDPNIVKHQLNSVGFTLLEEAFYLRNSNDSLGRLVFDPEIRGKTDRFIYKFGFE